MWDGCVRRHRKLEGWGDGVVTEYSVWVAFLTVLWLVGAAVGIAIGKPADSDWVSWWASLAVVSGLAIPALDAVAGIIGNARRRVVIRRALGFLKRQGVPLPLAEEVLERPVVVLGGRVTEARRIAGVRPVLRARVRPRDWLPEWNGPAVVVAGSLGDQPPPASSSWAGVVLVVEWGRGRIGRIVEISGRDGRWGEGQVRWCKESAECA